MAVVCAFDLSEIRKLLSSVEENFTLKMLIFCVRTENCYVVVLVGKEYIVSPVRGLNLIIYVYTSELGTPHTVFDHLKLTVLTKYFSLYI